MLYETYHTIYIVSGISSGIMLVISAALFFLLKIPRVIGDLSGKTARKAIENIRMQNEQSGNKVVSSSALNKKRGKLTSKISASGRLSQKSNTTKAAGMKTDKISTQELTKEANLQQKNKEEGTMVLNETTVLNTEAMSFSETSVLNTAAISPSSETMVLNAADITMPSQETMVLHMPDISPPETSILSSAAWEQENKILPFGQELSKGKERDAAFAIELDITYIHTQEIIEEVG